VIRGFGIIFRTYFGISPIDEIPKMQSCWTLWWLVHCEPSFNHFPLSPAIIGENEDGSDL